jgi:hypothetical protein
MAELCQKPPVVLEIDTEKNRDAEHKLPVGYWIENIVTYILSELDHLFGMTAWAEPPSLATECQEIFLRQSEFVHRTLAKPSFRSPHFR